MGIQGLLPLLKSTMQPIHIKDLEGCSVAVDTYSWLHKGALSCSTQLCKGLPTSRHIEYCMHRVNLLRHYGLKPILIFDGGLLPMKIEQENKRARTRKENLARAIEHESNGNSAAAYECYQKAVDISPSIAHELIQILNKENVSYVVAPYEADAQMTFLAVSKQVDAVITEDSDLIPFGCPRIIFKMDKFGQSVEFQYSWLQQNKELNFAGFTHEMLLQMCILSGCDYLQSLPGMGLKRAHALITKFKSYVLVLKHLRYSTVSVPPSYEESFQKALLTFKHQRVYDPVTEDIVHLYDIPDNLSNDLDFLGPSMPQHIAKGIARGDLDPFTLMPFKEESASSEMVISTKSEFKILKPESGRKKLDLPVQKNLLTKYFCFASLEAKRKFRAPRTSPINPSPADKSSFSPKDYCSAEATSINRQWFSASLLDSENVGSISPDDTVESGSAGALESLESSTPSKGMTDEKGISEHNLLQKFRHPMHKPCQPILKDCDYKNLPVPSVVEEEKTENKKVIVRSSYFKHRSINKSDDDNTQEKLLCKDIVASGPGNNIILDSSYKMRTADRKGVVEDRIENNKVIVRSSYFKHGSINKTNNDNKQEKLLCKDNVASDTGNNIDLDSSYKMRTTNKKVTARSSYFQCNSVNKNGQEKEQKRLIVKGDTAMGSKMNEDIILKRASSEDNCITMKRKTSPNDSVLIESMKPKYMRSDASHSENGCCAPNLDETSAETRTEGKFGSNISHLTHYCGIAEKSMERFVSVISSFRFSSSASRASGLRAPLKDIQNTRTNRSNVGVDFSQFAYTSTGKKTGIPSRRC